MTNNQKGFVRGVLYPCIAFIIHAVLAYIIAKGYLSDAGALLLTGGVAVLDHAMFPSAPTVTVVDSSATV